MNAQLKIKQGLKVVQEHFVALRTVFDAHLWEMLSPQVQSEPQGSRAVPEYPRANQIVQVGSLAKHPKARLTVDHPSHGEEQATSRFPDKDSTWPEDGQFGLGSSIATALVKNKLSPTQRNNPNLALV